MAEGDKTKQAELVGGKSHTLKWVPAKTKVGADIKGWTVTITYDHMIAIEYKDGKEIRTRVVYG